MDTPIPFAFTRHGRIRSDSRRISRPGIQAALRWGRRYHSHGDQIFRLDRRSVARARARGVRLDRYEGTTVVLTANGAIRSCWKNRDPRRIRR